MNEFSISDLPIFKKKFACAIDQMPLEIKHQLKQYYIAAIEVIDVILIPYHIKEIVNSQTTSHTPKIYSGNCIFGYDVKGGKKKTEIHSNEILSASNQTAYLSKIVAVQLSESGWRLIQSKIKLPLVIVTPNKLLFELNGDELNPEKNK